MNKIRLSEVACVEVSSIDKKIVDSERTVKLCNYTDVYYNWAITKAIVDMCMKGSVTDIEYNKFSLKKGQIAITKDSETRSDIGMSTYISEDFDDTVLAYHCALITPKEGKVSGKYLNALFNSYYGRKYFSNQATGSGQRYSLSKEAIESIQLPEHIPSIEQQNTIGAFFSNIDRKIELNTRINDNLAQIGENLYKYWFVQFDFPNKEGKPYKSSGGKMVWNKDIKREIPEGWEVCKISKLLGNFPKTTPVISSEYLDNGNFPIVDQSKNFICGFTNNNGAVLNIDSAIVFGDHTNIAKFINFPFARGADGTQIIKSNDKNIPDYLLYQQIVNLPVIEQGYSRHYKFLKEQNVIKPCFEIAELFNNYSKVLLGKKRQCIFENIELKQLRDYLLPLLMNGQVTIPV